MTCLTAYIVELLKVGLTNNYSECNMAHYHYMSGSVVGIHLSSHMPIFSCQGLEGSIYTPIPHN